METYAEPLVYCISMPTPTQFMSTTKGIEMESSRLTLVASNALLQHASTHMGSVLESFESNATTTSNFAGRDAVDSDSLRNAIAKRLLTNREVISTYYAGSLRELIFPLPESSNKKLNRKWISIAEETKVITANEVAHLERKIAKSCVAEVTLLQRLLNANPSAEGLEDIRCIQPRVFALAYKDSLIHGLVASDLIRHAFQALLTPFAVTLRDEFRAVNAQVTLLNENRKVV